MKNIIVAILFSVIFSTAAYANDSGAWFSPAPDQEGHGLSLFEWEDGRVFWWFAHHENFGQTWIMSSVEEGSDFVLYRPTAGSFPTSSSFELGEPIGTASLLDLENGNLFFSWDILVEEQTCEDVYGPVPPGPLDPRCKGEDNRFTPSRVLVEEFNEVGDLELFRLTPAP